MYFTPKQLVKLKKMQKDQYLLRMVYPALYLVADLACYNLGIDIVKIVDATVVQIKQLKKQGKVFLWILNP